MSDTRINFEAGPNSKNAGCDELVAVAENLRNTAPYGFTERRKLIKWAIDVLVDWNADLELAEHKANP